jgi:hypothetical protein
VTTATSDPKLVIHRQPVGFLKNFEPSQGVELSINTMGGIRKRQFVIHGQSRLFLYMARAKRELRKYQAVSKFRAYNSATANLQSQ